MAQEDKIVKYIDLPLQHIDDGVLTRMNRRGNAAQIKALLSKIRKSIPDVTLRTTFITGMPGETEEAFEALCDFVQEQSFDRLGCFAFSPEEGTPAADMHDRVCAETARRRAEVVMQLQMDIAEKKAHGMKGKRIKVLCEDFQKDTGLYVGRGQADAPDIDTKIFFSADIPVKSGDFVDVDITSSDGYDLVGEMVKSL
jgi:ribosomal protein S12 methylthiotransferase